MEDNGNSHGIELSALRARAKDTHVSKEGVTTVRTVSSECRKICLIAKLQSVFLPMKLFGLFIEEARNPCKQDFSRRKYHIVAKRLYQGLVLLALWLNVGKTATSFWIDKHDDTAVTQALKVVALLWFVQSAIQGTICVFTVHITDGKSPLKTFLLFWNSQPNFDELVTERYLIKCIKRTLICAVVLMALNSVLFALSLFLPAESLQPFAQALLSPLPYQNTAIKAVFFSILVYCTAAWLMPFAIFAAVSLTLIHQCCHLRKTLRVSASGNEVARIKVLRQQHSSLCSSVRKVDKLFRYLTLVVYVTNIPLVCLLLYNLIFVESSVTTRVALSFWFTTVAFMMICVSFLGAHLNCRVSNSSNVIYHRLPSARDQRIV